MFFSFPQDGTRVKLQLVPLSRNSDFCHKLLTKCLTPFCQVELIDAKKQVFMFVKVNVQNHVRFYKKKFKKI